MGERGLLENRPPKMHSRRCFDCVRGRYVTAALGEATSNCERVPPRNAHGGGVAMRCKEHPTVYERATRAAALAPPRTRALRADLWRRSGAAYPDTGESDCRDRPRRMHPRTSNVSCCQPMKRSSGRSRQTRHSAPHAPAARAWARAHGYSKTGCPKARQTVATRARDRSTRTAPI